MNKVDYLFVGCGISTMYMVDHLVQNNISDSIAILEKRMCVGGQVGVTPFGDMEVATSSDALRLCDKNIVNFYANITGTTLKFKQQISNYSHSDTSEKKETEFRDFIKQAAKIIGRDPVIRSDMTVRSLLKTSESTYNCTQNHLLESDVIDASNSINNKCEYLASPDWSLFVNKWLEKYSRFVNFDMDVVEITTGGLVITKHGKCFKGKQLILNIPITPLRSLISVTILDQIKSIPSIRIFVTTNKAIDIRGKGTHIILPKPFNKMYHVKDKVYMIAQSFGKNASYLKHASRGQLASILNNMLNTSIKITNMLKIYRADGIHYNKPLPSVYKDRQDFLHTASNPFENTHIVGSTMSMDQEWIEGACMSAKRVIDKIC